jgi:hypothetical protein
MKTHYVTDWKNGYAYSACGLRLESRRYGSIRPNTADLERVDCENCKAVIRSKINTPHPSKKRE